MAMSMSMKTLAVRGTETLPSVLTFAAASVAAAEIRLFSVMATPFDRAVEWNLHSIGMRVAAHSGKKECC